MKTRFTKRTAVLLTLCLLLAALVPVLAASAEAAACNCGNTPIIYITGKQPIYDENGRDVLAATDNQVADAAVEILPAFSKAMLTGDWTDYCNAMYEELAPFYAEYALDKDGNVCNNTVPKFTWSEETMQDTHQSTWVMNCIYQYDARLDPWEIAGRSAQFCGGCQARFRAR